MQKYHFIGIGGIGMSALARILLAKGKEVQGSDLAPSYVTEGLKEAGAELFFYHSESLLSEPMTVVYTTDIKKENPEYRFAAEKKFPLIHRSDLLSHLMEGSHPLLVTGTHGKTTTSALLTHVAITAGLDPSYAVGGTLTNTETNGSWGEGAYFVAEADESDGSFLNYSPFGAIITNLEEDHMNYWKTQEALIRGFVDFAAKVASPDHLFWCGDDTALASLNLSGVSYGFSEGADLQITRWNQSGWTLSFDLLFRGREYRNITLPLIGKHNVLNGAAVFGMGIALGIDEAAIRKAFETFSGVKRRMEKKGEVRGVEIYDDYGHHPTEIRATLKAVRAAAREKRVVVAFQPHRYTRTQECFAEFVHAFEEADALVLTEIYGARETPIPGVTSDVLFEQIRDHAGVASHFIRRESVATFLSGFLRPHDVVITMGAGDITRLATEILEKPISRLSVSILSGGRSAEHEVSLSSASCVTGVLNRELYAEKQFKISKEGDWFLDGEKLEFPEVVRILKTSDFCIPVLHGPFCEDGMIQGFLETLGIPYAGCDYRSCAVAMDKGWTKRLAMSYGIAVSPFIDFTAYEWESDRKKCLQQITEKLPFPLFAKAVHLGSTIGVGRATDLRSLEEAIDAACAVDFRFLVEEEVVGREIQFGFLGNFDIVISEPAEVTRRAEVHTYDEKYGPNATPTIPNISLPPDVCAAGKQIATKIYEAAGCTGLARIDFFLKPDGTWILNEINPMPGMTPTSAYPKMMAQIGFPMSSIIDQIVISGLHRYRYHNRHLIPKGVLG